MSDTYSWTAIDPVGDVYSYTVVRRPFLAGSEDNLPFTVLQVQFDQAPGVMLLTNLADEGAAARVRVGARIAIAFTEVSDHVRGGTVTMPYVRLDVSR